ncbi:hypothetical protein DCW30_16555 [Streptomyces alfalfae]|uniref:DUF305 domain-containing protein n=1 Tax=Streptomyces alfalfae TaxID=1642299 RepID=A0ABM6H1Y4_9ACTN|nr:hypothetical protein [Streptomyces alfalfae]AYA20274.1 hypothetical protein D3X13_32040 [Streptomyces fradiae]APY89818.1 hypothetical protein A7J05_32745 [Streptomyces alfalfae]QUI30122.1 hypothetical protein H9W91_04065 [Streptomyces alfalfae]RXX42639.1 hypothetical protein DCW30_16555 [Streptomyces alfalfae]RZM87907.1 hypothetical protein D4104_26360 [Streptomyces alfalfae]
MDDPRRFTLHAFLLLLAAVFAVSYAVGSWAGPVAPGMHGPRTATGDGGSRPAGDDAEDMPGMGGMHG